MMRTLHDAVLLVSFAAIDKLKVLQERHGHHDAPRWTAFVAREVAKGVEVGQTYCSRIVEAQWLGSAQETQTDADLKAVFRYRAALGGVEPKNLGEAESVFWAERLQATFATDDGPAYDWAVRKLGATRVIDTVKILQDAVSAGELQPDEAVQLCEAMRSFQPAPRYLRKVHPDPLHARDFD
jgi:predicted nucleic acid-binding protein